MGNDVSSTTARTLIPLDDSACWQLYNGVNERSEPISFFIAKQTFSVECRRSIQYLKTIRHPNIIKFLTGFKTFADQDSFIADCVHPLANKLNNNDIDSTAKLCLGLYQLSQALEFLHEKASISHNNVCLISLYISLNGIWKLGNFECACRYDNLNKKYLSNLKIIRSEECITPEEDEKNTTELNRQEIYAIDMYGYGVLIRNLVSIINIDDSLKSLLNDLQVSLTEEDPQLRPTWSSLLQTQLFQIDYIKATELLDRLPTVEDSELPTVVNSLSTYLDNLHAEYFNELLIRRLFVPFMFLCSSTRLKIIPRIIIPKNDDTNHNSWISIDKYRTYVIPILVDLFSYHVTCIRETLLEHFDSYWQLIDRTILINTILPQLIYGLKDSSNSICALTLLALAAMVPILGADIVVGGQRRQIFSDKLKRENVVLPKTAKAVSKSNTPVPTPPLPQRTKKSVETEKDKTKSLRLKPSPPPPAPLPPPKPTLTIEKPSVVPSVYTNGHNSTSTDSLEESPKIVVQNGISDHHTDDEIDNDDGQWSDWEHNPDPVESFNDYPQASSTFPSSSEVSTKPETITSPLKSLTLNHSLKSNWNPNAPLGSEYEIPPVVLTKKKETQDEDLVKNDTEDFFKDMAPKVETVELMRQLETMFNVDANHPTVQTKSAIKPKTTTTTTASSVSNKFGIMSHDHEDNQETENENNNWDE
ncbi:unnamed protein product [Adineta steineri]|uniref:Protein kinase domain-containing protein n=2 Tax=Adineta steineri TaxID=433720 RepID=A0A814UZX8_9BILA|nr:unnamed protein product [Adineta steineri]CAF3772063.1 unnamed protein product [Adineta steineri]